MGNHRDPELERLLLQERTIDIQTKINDLELEKQKLAMEQDDLAQLIHLAKKLGYTLS